MIIDAPAFFAAHEEAWQLWDVDAITGFFAVPQLIVSHGTSHFFETYEALRGHFATIVARENVFGVQFHPEKSSADGLRLLSSFAALAVGGQTPATAGSARA